jgi:mRNA-degrading endonuclease RelE of RelBE toxin-antitoxin system
MFMIGYTPDALDDLKRLRAYDARRISDAIKTHLCLNPEEEAGPKKRIVLQDGRVLWQLRAGDFRIFYKVEHDRVIVVVVAIRHKGNKTTGEIL